VRCAETGSDERQFRKRFELLVRKAQAQLRNDAALQRNFHQTSNVHIAKGASEAAIPFAMV
jgi:hypothetical protein